ncbi:MAG: methyltransferase [Gemmataceae bacterium]
MTHPDPTPVLELMNAFRKSGVLFAGVSLGVFDQLATGPAELATLARRISAAPEALGRLLDALVGLGLLERTAQGYANAPAAAAYLAKTSPLRLTGYITYSDRVLWQMWHHLADAIREGSHRWKQTFDLDGPIFASLFRTEADKREFVWGMHGYGQISSPVVVEAFDLSGFRHLVDLGGATGHLALAACRRYPHLRATVFDLPGVIPTANEVIACEPDLGGRVSSQAGDFFVDNLPDADLFAVGRILHDWSEDKIVRLLARIYQALPAGGALLIAEKLLDDDRSGPPWAVLQSLNMLVCTEGRERTVGEYEALLRAAGFRQVEARRTASPLDAVLATK